MEATMQEEFDKQKELIKSVTHCPTCGNECSIGVDGETHYYIPKQAKEGLEKLGKKIGDSEWDDVFADFYTNGGMNTMLSWLKEHYYPPKPKEK